MNRIFSYVITHDTGFAPNPYGGVLTLATCKPKIRKVGKAGDWLLGTGSKNTIGSNRLVYAAQVSEVLTLAEYGKSTLYKFKIPCLSGEPWQRHGDNIYWLNANDEWRQRRNLHHNVEHVKRDLSGENVLVCNDFWYFGKQAPAFPDELKSLIKAGPGHKTDSTPLHFDVLKSWLSSFQTGINGVPFYMDTPGFFQLRPTNQE